VLVHPIEHHFRNISNRQQALPRLTPRKRPVGNKDPFKDDDDDMDDNYLL